MKIKQDLDGTWRVGRFSFDSEEEALIFLQQGQPKEINAQRITFVDVLKWGFAFFAVATFIAACARIINKDDTSRNFSQMDALFMCQQRLKQASIDPTTADVPYVANQGRGDEYVFAWGRETTPVRMRNGLGMEVAAGASCVVSTHQRRVTQLTLDGKTIF